MGPSVAMWMALGGARSMRWAISRLVGRAQRSDGYVGMATDGKPSGVRNEMDTPSLQAFSASDVKVRTTPLT